MFFFCKLTLTPARLEGCCGAGGLAGMLEKSGWGFLEDKVDEGGSSISKNKVTRIPTYDPG